MIDSIQSRKESGNAPGRWNLDKLWRYGPLGLTQEKYASKVHKTKWLTIPNPGHQSYSFLFGNTCNVILGNPMGIVDAQGNYFLQSFSDGTLTQTCTSFLLFCKCQCFLSVIAVARRLFLRSKWELVKNRFLKLSRGRDLITVITLCNFVECLSSFLSIKWKSSGKINL